MVIPLDILEYLSLNVVGEPPINGMTWMEGVDALGGPLSMRLLATWGIVIMVTVASWFLKQQEPPTTATRREVTRAEYALFFISTGIFFVVNFAIGYAWWDPAGFLGMGSLFFPSIASLVVLGCIPAIASKVFKLDRNEFASNTATFKKTAIPMAIAAFGYGLVSSIWHCCSFFEPKIYFFYFVTKIVQLWGMCSFFFKWGFKMFMNRGVKFAYVVTSVLFGLCYPWHTVGFAITFMIFGFLLCVITKKTGSYLAGMLLLYLSYIFHTGLPWQGAEITILIIHPVSIGMVFVVLILGIWMNGRRSAKPVT